MLVVPAAARCACWLNAWLADRVSPDAAIDGLTAGMTNTFAIRPGAAPLSPALLFGELRSLGVTRASAALPVPGHLVGLGGPAEFNLAATEAEQALILHGSGLGLTPSLTDSAALWQQAPADPPAFLPDVAHASRDLRQTMLDSTEQLIELDVVAWSPDVADALMNLRADRPLDAPMSFASAEAARLLHDGLRAAEIARLGLRDEGGALTAVDMLERRRALQPLLLAAHSAVVAGCSSVDGR